MIDLTGGLCKENLLTIGVKCHSVTKQDRDLEEFLEQAPWMRKWVHECAACHQRGYKPDMEKSDPQ
jgi:predicted CxxxxCH...CXXCH cytochrome family protein